MKTIDELNEEIAGLAASIGILLEDRENLMEELLSHPDRVQPVPNALEIIASQVARNLDVPAPRVSPERPRDATGFWVNLSGLTAMVQAFLEGKS